MEENIMSKTLKSLLSVVLCLMLCASMFTASGEAEEDSRCSSTCCCMPENLSMLYLMPGLLIHSG